LGLSSQNQRNIPLGHPVFDDEMEAAAIKAFRCDRFVMGEEVRKFEEEFACYVGTKYAVSTSSGTNALQIALLALGISKSARVITSAFSFVASANAVLHAGGKPVFADIDAETFNVLPGKMRHKITKNTEFLLPVHLYGYPCNMSEIMALAEDNDLKVVEDACQAHGAEYRGQKAGAIGVVGCFSFYPSKNMTVCGDGGMITTNDEDVAKLAAKLRNCGRKSQYEHDIVGYTSRLNTANAAIGRVQLKRLDAWNKKRVQVASLYDKLLSDVPEVCIPPKGDVDVKPVYHLYVIRAKRRDALRAWLEKNGVGVGVHYPMPIPSQPVYKRLFGFEDGEYPVSEQVSRECLSLPIYPSLSEDSITYVCERINEFYSMQ